MKRNIFIITILLALLSVSCEDYLDVNTDPNNPEAVTPDLVLPVGLWYTADYIQQDRGLNHLGNMMMFSWGESQGYSWYDEEFKYLVTTTFYDQMFDDAYTRGLKQYQVLAELEEEEYGYYRAMGEIMKAYHFQILVDLYGDIPYSEALLRGGNAQPAYDGAQAVYADLLVKLTAAIDMIKAADEYAGSVLPEEDDFIFGGEMTDWIKFANTIKVRILARLSDVDAATVTSEMAAITAEGSGFITNDVIIQPGYLVEENKQNPFWNELGTDVGGTQTLSYKATCATQFILDYLADINDPRISLLFEEPATGHLGVDQGADNNDPALAPDYVSNIGPGILKSATMGSIIFSLAESNFNQAELAQKGFGGDPESLFNAGIIASCNYLGVDAAETEAYLAQSTQNVNFANSANPLEAIMTQKWLAGIGITAEQAWFDYVRTGYPVGLPVSTQASTSDRPVRLFYPASEITTNGNNVPAQPNAFTSKIFWAN
ncbi:MAG: SusD/RagB family nutrient-binding outer membrane lipoprotein [Bacteroidales bacterium]|nr:SusD/RagB family nutrient-binding outer membrane lipoprotein [Bacteroidales bacterium]MBN2819714.1 SusD/RagB family nutrient-binding outer membrane lipoprotein [Bacteroidales bacterium]